MLPASRIAAQETVITYELGDFTVSTLSDGGQNAGSDMLVGATPEILKTYLPEGTFPLEIQSFLVRTPDRTVLIDAGVGTNLSRNLQSLEVAEDGVHVILLTHMHGDHIGGLLREGKKVFTKAELYVAKAEYDYWVNEKERGADARKVLEAYRDKLHVFVPGEPENPAALFPGFQAVAAYGHTPGHTSFLIESRKSRLLIWGDIVHSTPIQFPRPEVSLTVDYDRREAAETRKKIFEYVTKNRIRVAGAHIKFPAIGNVTAGKKEGYEFTAVCTCEAI
jgi:glyoxylase-like metal-dependent hydrolase (beta-lactamase superfamily II)